jgi:hypothetical protein
MYSPATTSMEKMTVELINPDGSLYNADTGTVTVTLLIYARYSKLSRY